MVLFIPIYICKYKETVYNDLLNTKYVKKNNTQNVIIKKTLFFDLTLLQV